MFIAMLWGGTFLVGHIAMRYTGPLFFVGLRFSLAGLLSVILFHRAMRGITRTELLAGAAIGLTIFLGNAPQAYGLQLISSSTSAFLTALYVPMVPVLQWIVLRRSPRPTTWIGIGLAFLGLVCLAGPDALRIGLGRGELVTVLSAVSIAAEVLLIGHFAPAVNTTRLAIVQLWAAGLMSFAAMPIIGEGVPAFSWVWLSAVIALALASTVIQQVMNWAQKSVAPARATIIYASEPVWGGVFGRLAGERLPALALVGALFIVAGVIASEWKPRRRQRTTSATG